MKMKMKMKMKKKGSGISDTIKAKIKYLRVCKSCRVIEQDLVIWKKKHCPLCGSSTAQYVMPASVKANGAKAKVKENGSFSVDKSQMSIISMVTGRTKDFDCPGFVSNIIKGPVVTEYEFTPDRFTRIKKLRTLDEDLALALSVDTVSIRRIPGRPCIGISIPNADRTEVTFKSSLENVIKKSDTMAVPLNFGIMSDGSPYVEDLAEYPHLLVGGATGTGKSVLLHQLISSLLLVRSPKQLQFVFIDPKTVELFSYKGIPHLAMEPVSTVWRAIDVLSEVIKTMKDRTEILHAHQTSNIKEFNSKIMGRVEAHRVSGDENLAREELKRLWPYIVVVIDEFADIVIQEKKSFINRMASISQMARASGISVIAATQRPSVDVLPGKVKVNFLARAAFRMPSARDSQTVLNYRGAETLLGKGDMFMLSPDKTGLQRIHVAHCRREDRDGIIRRAVGLGYSEHGILLGGEIKKEG